MPTNMTGLFSPVNGPAGQQFYPQFGGVPDPLHQWMSGLGGPLGQIAQLSPSASNPLGPLMSVLGGGGK